MDAEPLRFSDSFVEAENVAKYRPGGFCPVDLGQVIASRFKVIHKLGFGGFSTLGDPDPSVLIPPVQLDLYPHNLVLRLSRPLDHLAEGDVVHMLGEPVTGLVGIEGYPYRFKTVACGKESNTVRLPPKKPKSRAQRQRLDEMRRTAAVCLVEAADLSLLPAKYLSDSISIADFDQAYPSSLPPQSLPGIPAGYMAPWPLPQALEEGAFRRRLAEARSAHIRSIRSPSLHEAPFAQGATREKSPRHRGNRPRLLDLVGTTD